MRKKKNVIRLPGNILPLRDLLMGVVKNIEKSYQRRSSGKDLCVGLQRFNDMADGFCPNGFTGICGNPLLMRATIFKASMEARNIPVVLLSRMDRASIVLEMISLETGIHVMDLKEGRLRSEDWPTLARASGILMGLPVFIENPGDIIEACSKARSLADNFDIRAIFIDDLKSFCADTDISEDIKVADCLRKLSRELKIPVFAGL